MWLSRHCHKLTFFFVTYMILDGNWVFRYFTRKNYSAEERCKVDDGLWQIANEVGAVYSRMVLVG